MKYDMFKKEDIKRVLDAFDAHDLIINKKYEAMKKSKDNYWHSDRDRFVGRFFNKYKGKFFILINKEVIGHADTVDNHSFFNFCDPESVYSSEYKNTFYRYRGEPIIRVTKKYLCVSYFGSVNTSACSGYIEMNCYDIFGDRINFRLDYDMLSQMQFKEIPEEEFNRAASFFSDDRDEQEYQVTRYLTDEELKARKNKRKGLIKVCRGLAKEVVTVMAKDSDLAMKKCTNAIEVHKV